MSSSSISPDVVFLHALEVECVIGFIDWERQVKQKLLFDIELPVDCTRAAASDDVADTVDYKKVAKRVLAWVGESQFQLVETLAHKLALMLIEEFELEWVRITVNKPGAIRHSKNVGIRIERRRSN